MKYAVVLRQDEEGNWLASVPAFPGCHTWGETYEDAVRYAQEALIGYLDALAAHGDDIPEEKTSPQPASLGITVRTPVIA